MKRFKEWQAAYDVAVGDEIKVTRACEVAREIEKRLIAAPTLSPRDLALKVVASTRYNDFSLESDLYAEIAAIAGISNPAAA